MLFFGGSSIKKSVCSTVSIEDKPNRSRKTEELVRGREIKSNEESVSEPGRTASFYKAETLWSLLESYPGTFQLDE